MALLALLTLAGCTSGRADPGPPTTPRRPATPTNPSPSTPPTSPAPSTPPAATPAGRLEVVPIPGGASRFGARPAYVYLPPAAIRHPRERLPVLELLHGNPGDPDDWVDHGDARATLDGFAATHDGRAPIVVMPDINGTHVADSECVREPGGGNVEEYLTRQVPDYVREHFPAARGGRRWTVAGLSEGGTCALMLALRHPTAFRGFGDFSGLARPTLGPRDDERRTLDELFAGSRRDYDQHDPMWLLARHRYPTLAGRLIAGADDAAVIADETRVAAAARAARLPVQRTTEPGKHAWTVWAAALRGFLPWMWRLVGRTA